MKPDASRTAFEGTLLAVTVERWGDREREIVEHPGAVAIVAVDRQDRVAFVRQLREATRSQLLELPAGTCEEGEDPLATAQRELREECGLTGGTWKELAGFWTTPGFSREYMRVYLAEDVEEGELDPDADEELELVHYPASELAARVAELEDAKTIAGVLLFLEHRRRTG